MLVAIGIILFSCGITYIVNMLYNLPNTFWFFISVLIAMNGFYFSVKKWKNGEKIFFPLLVLLMGTFELLFSLNLLYYSPYTFLGAVFISIGVSLIISEIALKRYSPVISALAGGMIAVSSLMMAPFFNKGSLFDQVFVYTLGSFVVIVGLSVMIFPVLNKNKRMK